MKRWAVFILPLSIVSVTVFVLFNSEKLPSTPVSVDKLGTNIEQTNQTFHISEIHQSKQRFPSTSLKEQDPGTKAQTIQANTTEQPNHLEPSILQQTKALLTETTTDLQLDAELSTHNLMVLKDLASRLNDLTNFQEDSVLWQQGFPEDWPFVLRDALQRLTTSIQAEHMLQLEWKNTLMQKPDAYRQAFLTQQKQILGTELYTQLYSEDEMIADEAGLSAHHRSQEDIQALNSPEHLVKLDILKQWQAKELSDTELKDALSNSLSYEEINQLIDTRLHESEWLAQVDQFLDEYHYIEQSGITGEDELQMRHELIEKHFTPENRLIVNQFLFNTETHL